MCNHLSKKYHQKKCGNPHKQTAVLASSCRKCLNLALLMEGSRDSEWSTHLCDRDERGSGKVEGCYREIRLVEPHPEEKAADRGYKGGRGFPSHLPPGTWKGPKKWGEWKQVPAQEGHIHLEIEALEIENIVTENWLGCQPWTIGLLVLTTKGG